MNRKIIFAVLAVLMVTFTVLAVAQTKKLDISGTWTRVALGGYGNPGTETMMLVHNDPYLYLIYRIKDGAGERTLDLKGMIDSKPHPQEVEGQPATLLAQWEGESFILDIKRERSIGYVHNRRKITFSADGKVMTVERTQYSKEGTLRGSGTEKWERK